MTTAARPSDQEITAQFNVLKSELHQLAQKIGELEADADEHRLVIDALEPMNGDRKCFRMIGGVLTERTVADVLPELKNNQEGVFVLHILRFTLCNF